MKSTTQTPSTTSIHQPNANSSPSKKDTNRNKLAAPECPSTIKRIPEPGKSRKLDEQRTKARILLGITGSVAAVKGPELALKLARECGADVCILLTRGGENFWTKAANYDLESWRDYVQHVDHGECTDDCGEIRLHYARDEWKGWNKLGDPVLHIELRDWADVAVVAPLSAHTLAKLATGSCDDTLSCILRAWDYGHGTRPGKPLVLAPAMNTAMWIHPLTKSQLDIVKGFWNGGEGGREEGVLVVEPQAKTLACGEVGTGALADVSEIIQVVKTLIMKDE